MLLHAGFGLAAEELVEGGLEDPRDVAQPDLRVVDLEADERELGVVLALVPFRNDRIPQAVNGLAIVDDLERAAKAGEQAVSLGRVAADRAVRLTGPWRGSNHGRSR